MGHGGIKMEKYTVVVKQVIIMTMEIDAFTQEDAEEKAKEAVSEVLELAEEEGLIFESFVEDQNIEEIIEQNQEEY